MASRTRRERRTLELVEKIAAHLGLIDPEPDPEVEPEPEPEASDDKS